MLQHVVLNPQRGKEPCTLERIRQMTLVVRANVFVIGEAKGAEICSAITLSNSGWRTAITIHSQSFTDTVEKMVYLALRGSPNSLHFYGLFGNTILKRKMQYSINFATAISLSVEFLRRNSNRESLYELDALISRRLVLTRLGRSNPCYIRAKIATSFLYRLYNKLNICR